MSKDHTGRLFASEIKMFNHGRVMLCPSNDKDKDTKTSSATKKVRAIMDRIREKEKVFKAATKEQEMSVCVLPG